MRSDHLNLLLIKYLSSSMKERWPGEDGGKGVLAIRLITSVLPNIHLSKIPSAVVKTSNISKIKSSYLPPSRRPRRRRAVPTSGSRRASWRPRTSRRSGRPPLPHPRLHSTRSPSQMKYFLFQPPMICQKLKKWISFPCRFCISHHKIFSYPLSIKVHLYQTSHNLYCTQLSIAHTASHEVLVLILMS